MASQRSTSGSLNARQPNDTGKNRGHTIFPANQIKDIGYRRKIHQGRVRRRDGRTQLDRSRVIICNCKGQGLCSSAIIARRQRSTFFNRRLHKDKHRRGFPLRMAAITCANKEPSDMTRVVCAPVPYAQSLILGSHAA